MAKKEITTGIERLQMKTCKVIRAIVEIEKEIKKKPVIKKTVRGDMYKSQRIHIHFLKAKEELQKAVKYIGECDKEYRKNIGRKRPVEDPEVSGEKEKQDYFEGFSGEGGKCLDF